MDRLVRLLAAGAALLAVLASACATSTAYVSSSSQGMFFKIPNGWHTYSQSTLKRDGLVTQQPALPDCL